MKVTAENEREIRVAAHDAVYDALEELGIKTKDGSNCFVRDAAGTPQYLALGVDVGYCDGHLSMRFAVDGDRMTLTAAELDTDENDDCYGDALNVAVAAAAGTLTKRGFTVTR